MLQALLEKNQPTQQALGKERKEKEIEKNTNTQCTRTKKTVAFHQPTNQQAIEEELAQEVAKKVECGVPREVKKEPPGLFREVTTGAGCEKRHTI